jgi:hypothetical protein
VQSHIEQCDIRGSDTGDAGESCLLGCDTVLLGEYFPVFQRNVSSPSGCSGQE